MTKYECLCPESQQWYQIVRIFQALFLFQTAFLIVQCTCISQVQTSEDFNLESFSDNYCAAKRLYSCWSNWVNYSLSRSEGFTFQAEFKWEFRPNFWDVLYVCLERIERPQSRSCTSTSSHKAHFKAKRLRTWSCDELNFLLNKS